MVIVRMLCLLLISVSVQASEFTHIKLNPAFEAHILRAAEVAEAPDSSSRMGTKSFLGAQDDFERRMRQALLGARPRAKTMMKSMDTQALSGLPNDGEESPLYEQIREELGSTHAAIGQENVTRINHIRRQYNMGTENFSGFNWQKPVGTVNIFVDRQVVPNLEVTSKANEWLIQDTFTFEIDAVTFLKALQDSGLAEMSSTEIGAFAGLTFKRVYTSYHFSETYEGGLASDFTKLFLPFLHFNEIGLEHLGHNEVIRREDLFSARVGGLITSPPVHGVSVSGGLLAEYALEKEVSLQKHAVKNDTDRSLTVSVRSKSSANVTATTTLQLDFFKLLKFTLLRFDLSYKYAKGEEYALGLSQQQWQNLKQDPVEKVEFRKLLHLAGDVKALEPYVVRLDQLKEEELKTSGSILLWGRIHNSNTKQLRIIKDGVVSVFYGHTARSIRFVQSFWSRLWSAISYKLLKLPTGTKNVSTFTKEFALEYKATHPQAEDPRILRVEQAEDFSFKLNQSYEAASTKKKSYKEDVIWFLKEFTTLPATYRTIVRNDELVGPMLIESKLSVDYAGFKYLVGQNVNKIFGHIVAVCKSRQLSAWTDERVRAQMLREQQRGADDCVKKLGNDYLTFKTDYDANYLRPSLAKFKNFITKYYKATESISDLNALFGVENTFINGKFTAHHQGGELFTLPFSQGEFRGHGVVDNFKRDSGPRQPAGILAED